MKKNKYKYASIIWVSFFFPQVALLLYLMEDDKKTDKAQALLSGLNLFIGLAIFSILMFTIVIILPMILYMFNS